MRRRGDTRFLHARLALFFVAAALWLAALLSGREELALVALVALVLAMALRFLPGMGGSEDLPAGDGEQEPPGGG